MIARYHFENSAGQQMTKSEKVSASLRQQYKDGTRVSAWRKRGTEAPHWKGDNIGYTMVHRWLIDTFGNPDTCENCGTSGLTKSKIHWANKSGNYKRDRDDWMRLCMSCHMRYDFKTGQRQPTKQKLIASQVLAIREDARVQSKIAKDYGISPSTVSEIKRKVIWNHL